MANNTNDRDQRIADLKAELEALETQKPRVNAGSAAAVLGLGAILAPFTGGMSLAYAAGQVAICAGVDKAEGRK